MSQVVYQGTKTSYSEQAAHLLLGDEIVCIGKETFALVFEALQVGQADSAIIPIENTLIGSIAENYDLLQQFDVQISAEITLKIEHCLLGVSGSSIETLKEVYSHPKALDQCRHFFQSHPWIKPVIHYDTAGAAEEVAQRGQGDLGAIASEKTAAVYGLTRLSRGIEDNPHNYTRFLLLRRQGNVGEGNKCSLLFTLQSVPGALVSVLQPLACQGINLTKLESRPLRGSPFEYLFYADLTFKKTTQQEVIKWLDLIRLKTQTLKLLGFYDCGI